MKRTPCHPSLDNLRRAAALVFFGLLLPAPLLAQGFPKGPVQMLIPFGPGGTTDLMARALQPELDRALGGSVVIVNKAGAGGAIALADLARAKPDGQMIAMTTIGPQVLQPALRKLTYAAGDFDFICGTYDVPLMLMVKAINSARHPLHALRGSVGIQPLESDS